MTNFLKTVFTGKDNASGDIGRVLWAGAFVVFLGLVIYQTLKAGTFDMMTYVAAASALLAGGSAGLRIKAPTEPEPGK